ncbi:unnamed protein product [Ilex paraguariensis]|uniref:HRDC domain-containing protein n=1 Tax=Ilex paraguariensis TaxID=185542 RepID=A0ABC8U5Y7_9AQUA
MLFFLVRNATLQQISKRIPRTTDELLEINGIGKVKIVKYGDRILETIEATIKEHYKGHKTNSSNDSNDSAKRRRDTIKASNGNFKDGEDDFFQSTGRSKKRILKKQTKCPEVIDYREPDYYEECVDEDLDFDDSNCNIGVNGSNIKIDRNGGGRVLPSWSGL